MKEVYDLSWGDPFIVRQALTETLGQDCKFGAIYYNKMSYPPHIGTPILIEKLKDMAQRQSGHRPKHLVVTCGATGAINAALYALKDKKIDLVKSNRRYYPFYPSIIGMADMVMVHQNNSSILDHYTSLIDSPSAPEGLVFPFKEADIWDAAYASKTYTMGGHTPKKWKIMCGSLSKTLGLAGLRLGWASTDNDELGVRIVNHVTASCAGMSSLSMAVAEETLECLDQDRFEARSTGYLDNNREEMQKVLTRFGQGDVPCRGMFAIIELGKPERRALERAGVKWLPGSSWGEDSSWARLSLGQTREVIRSAVKGILK